MFHAVSSAILLAGIATSFYSQVVAGAFGTALFVYFYRKFDALRTNRVRAAASSTVALGNILSELAQMFATAASCRHMEHADFWPAAPGKAF